MYNNLGNSKSFKFDISLNVSNFFVDIIIPFKEQYGLLIKVVESLLSKVYRPMYNLHLVDDGSKNSNFINNFAKYPNIKTHRLEKSKGFGAAVNFGLSKCESNLVCVMHSDTLVTEANFLYNLCKDFIYLKNNKVATVCSVTNNTMSKTHDMIKTDKSESKNPEFFDEVASPLICTLLNKQIIELCGGIPEYPLCWYEAESLAHKINIIGYKQAYSPSSFVYHHGGATIRSILNESPGKKKILVENYETYKKLKQM